MNELTKLENIEKHLECIFQSLQNLDERYKQVEKENKELREYLKVVYEHRQERQLRDVGGNHAG